MAPAVARTTALCPQKDFTMKELDCRGLACPQPVLRCRDAVDAGASCLQIIVDNDPACENVRRYLQNQNFSCDAVRKGPLWIISATREAHDQHPVAAPHHHPDVTEGRTLVLITTPTLGRGDDTLGTRLMTTFLQTLPEMTRLWRVVLLNGGVKLAATPGDPLDALKKLSENGVDILVCGTCLAHYGLTEAKAVGETSNMLDIVTSLDVADKVVRP